MNDFTPIIDENINPCRGCEDYEEDGCKSNGGCGKQTKNEYHGEDVVWCEDCVHYHAYGIDGEGECTVDGSETYYGADASVCDYFHQKEGE